jgi:hypothetical protein
VKRGNAHRRLFKRNVTSARLACVLIAVSISALALPGCAGIQNPLPRALEPDEATTPQKLERAQDETPVAPAQSQPKRSDAASPASEQGSSANEQEAVRAAIDTYLSAWLLPAYDAAKVRALMTPSFRKRFAEGDSIATVQSWKIGPVTLNQKSMASADVGLTVVSRELPDGSADHTKQTPVVPFRLVLMNGKWLVDQGIMGQMREQ